MEPTICEVSFISNENPVDSDPLTKAIQNTLILDEISKYISIVDMINCRSANNLWKNEWTPVVQKRSKFQLCLIDQKAMLIKDMKIGLNDTSLDWHKRAQTYFDSMDNNEIDARTGLLIQWLSKSIYNFPCSRLKIGARVFRTIDQSVQGKFFRAISYIVTELCLENCFDYPYFHFEKLEKFELEFYKLKTLEMKMSFASFYHRDRAVQFFENFLPLAPNLNALSLVREGCSGNNQFLTRCITVINNPERIKTLKISGKIAYKEFNQLVKKKFNLTEFRASFDIDGNFQSKSFETFLSSQSNSLKQLFLTFKNNLESQNYAITFPRLSVLEQLDLDCFGNVEFPGINIQKVFPSLKYMKINGGHEHGDALLNSNSQPVQTLEELDIRMLGPYPTAVSEACRKFPNMKRISILCFIPNVESLNAAAMSSLEEVTLWCHIASIQDHMIQVLTGFSKIELEEAEQNGVLVEMGREPLAFLHRVKILRLENAALTDLMCILGPMKLQSLQCLDLRISSPEIKHGISEAMLAEMREKFTVLL